MYRHKASIGILSVVVLSMLLSGCFGLFKKTVDVKGTVVYAVDGSAVAGATVELGTMTATTNADGAYSFSKVAPDSYKLSIIVDGSTIHFLNVVVGEKGPVVINVRVPETEPFVVDHVTEGIPLRPVPEALDPVIEGTGIGGVPLTRGPGLDPSELTNGFSAVGFEVGTPSLSKAIEVGDYFQFGLTVEEGYTANLSQMTMSLRRSALNGPMNFVLYASLDDFATDGIHVTDLYYYGRTSGTAPAVDPTETDPYYYTHSDLAGRPNLATSPGDMLRPIDLSTVDALQGIPGGSVVTFRLYGWGNESTTVTNSVALGRMTGPRVEGVVIVE